MSFFSSWLSCAASALTRFTRAFSSGQAAAPSATT
ncbi:hypothetical protein [Pseudomonas sp. FSL R10-0399]